MEDEHILRAATNILVAQKLWLTLAAGTLPVYYGAPNIKEHVPGESSEASQQHYTLEGDSLLNQHYIIPLRFGLAAQHTPSL